MHMTGQLVKLNVLAIALCVVLLLEDVAEKTTKQLNTVRQPAHVKYPHGTSIPSLD